MKLILPAAYGNSDDGVISEFCSGRAPCV